MEEELAQFAKVALALRKEETPELTLLRVSGGDEALYDAYLRPGQYAALRLPEAERPAYFAVASAPGERHLEFLVRGGGRIGEALRRLRPGDTVEVSPPMGEGFPLERVAGRPLWLVAAGTGIAAIRPVVLHELARPGGRARIHLVFGSRGHGFVPFLDEIERWGQAGVEVHLASSRDGNGLGWSGHRGYVQDVLLAVRPDLSEAGLLVCGMPPMVDAVRSVALALGLAPERLLTNV